MELFHFYKSFPILSKKKKDWGRGGYNHNVIAQNKQNPKFIDNNIYHIRQHVLVSNQRIPTSGSFEG